MSSSQTAMVPFTASPSHSALTTTAATTPKPDKPQVVKKENILEEDEYIGHLDRIIKRDFFPELQRLEDQIEVLDAVESNDIDLIRNIQRRQAGRAGLLSSVRETPSSLPGTPHAHTPGRQSTADAASMPPPAVPSVNDKMRLDEFQKVYTSEDNASFSVILARETEKRIEKQAWMAEAERAHTKAIENGDDGKIAGALTWEYTRKNALMNVPDGVKLSAEEELTKLMGPPKTISTSNTRFRRTSQTAAAAAAAARARGEQTPAQGPALDPFGRRVQNDSYDLDVVRNTGPAAPSPKVGGFSFVRTPSPSPSMLGGASPLMTWGEVDGTPMLLDHGGMDDTPGPFRIAKTPTREIVGRNLAARTTDVFKRTALGSSLRSPVSKSPSGSKTPNFSKAAQHLAATSAVNLHSNDFGAQLRRTYTPSKLNQSPASRRSSGAGLLATPSPSRAHAHTPVHQRVTRSSHTARTPTHTDPSSTSLTDDLLDI